MQEICIHIRISYIYPYRRPEYGDMRHVSLRKIQIKRQGDGTIWSRKLWDSYTKEYSIEYEE
ncbi:hypothetical protein HanHA300_Chr07g0244921 [Helianthus annuus]|nr:hypothetical protein HanHA300_Chr07g0244921 [Helianthus annuus]KAJ0563353.1 hypothetical protein HanHA89_Chr07g0262111 [Helianthus annuus]